MPKHLLLCRHADSLPATSDQKDFDRPLSPEGIEDAQRAASWIKNQALEIPAIYHSAAVRTTQTAQIFASALDINADGLHSDVSLYNAPAKSWVKKISLLQNEQQAVVLVGHNPGISELVESLTSGKIQFVPTGGAICLTFETADWQEIGLAKVIWDLNY